MHLVYVHRTGTTNTAPPHKVKLSVQKIKNPAQNFFFEKYVPVRYVTGPGDCCSSVLGLGSVGVWLRSFLIETLHNRKEPRYF